MCEGKQRIASTQCLLQLRAVNHQAQQRMQVTFEQVVYWQHIHNDVHNAGSFQGKVFLRVVDAYSLWPEVIEMSTTTSIRAASTIDYRHGLPPQLVSINGPQFNSDEFSTF